MKTCCLPLTTGFRIQVKPIVVGILKLQTPLKQRALLQKVAKLEAILAERFKFLTSIQEVSAQPARRTLVIHANSVQQSLSVMPLFTSRCSTLEVQLTRDVFRCLNPKIEEFQQDLVVWSFFGVLRVPLPLEHCGLIRFEL